MIESIDLSKLRNGEYSQFIQDIVSIVNENDPVAMQVDAPFQALKTVGTAIEGLFKVPTGSAITAELEKFDLLRDNAYKGFSGIVRSHTFSDNEVIQKHAAVLDAHLNLFGRDITVDSYQSESSSIRNLLADVAAQPELSAAVAALNLQSWQTALETANNNFVANYLLRAKELGTDNAESLKAKRIEANAAYYKLRDNLNARYVITEGAAPYQTVVGHINGLLTNYSDLLARRAGGSNTATPVVPPVNG